MQPTPWWARPASVCAGMAAAVAGWVLVGRLPDAPEAKGAVPVDVPVRSLRPSERVVFCESLWSGRALLLGGLVAIGAVAAMVLDVLINPTVLLVLGLVLVLQAKARIQIDGDGVLLDLPLLRVRRRVHYREVRYARVVINMPARRWPLVENTTRSGYIGHDGPGVVLQMSDGREFVVTVREAATAAALVNGELNRRRAVGAEPC